ncbi:hypothetical protein LINPERPRIM_LOCUS37961, partial [Linum perenne]
SGRIFRQEGAEIEAENENNEDVTGGSIDAKDKDNQEPVEKPRKTSKYMTNNEPLDSNGGPHTNMETSTESPSNHSAPDARCRQGREKGIHEQVDAVAALL